MKRRIAFMLVVMLTLSLLPVGVFASPQVVEEIHVTVTVPLVGETDDTVHFSWVDHEKYTVTAVEGIWVDAGGYTVEDAFEKDSIYQAEFYIEMQDGYTFSEHTKVFVNGSEEGISLLGMQDKPAECFYFTTIPEELGTVEEINLPNVPEGKLGDTVASYTYNGEHYTVNGVWYRYDVALDTYQHMEDGAVLEDGAVYRLSLQVWPEVGYVISDDCTVLVNGQEDSYWWSSWNCAEIYRDILFTTEISQVEFSENDLPKAEIGKNFTDDPIPLSMPAGSHYKVYGSWSHTNEDGESFTSGTFQDGKAYFLTLDFVAEAGYSFADDLYVEFAEKEYWLSGIPQRLACDIRVSFLEEIDRVELLELPEPTVGQTLSKEPFAVKVPEGANYTATGIWEYDTKEESPVQKGGLYQLHVDIEAAEGYEFASTYTIRAYGIDHVIDEDKQESASFWREFSFREKVSQVEILGVTVPKDGVSADTKDIRVPQGSKYTLEEATWYDEDTHEPVSQFEKGHEYYLQINLMAKSGYEFDVVTAVELNGETYDGNVYGTELYFSYDVSLKEVVEKIRIENVPTMKVGAQSVASVDIPENVSYDIVDYWQVWDGTEQDFVDFDGVFESGKVYRFMVEVNPKEGYGFGEDTLFLVDGKQNQYTSVLSNNAYYKKVFQVGNTVIERVELTVTPPVIGNHSSVSPSIQVANGNGFTLVTDNLRTYWVVKTSEGDDDGFDGYFEEEYDYGAQMFLLADDGYMFSEDVVVVVNGIVMPESDLTNLAKELWIDYIFGMKGAEEPSSSSSSYSFVWLWIVIPATVVIVAGVLALVLVLRMKRK